MRLLLFALLPVDEVDDLGVIHVEAHHLRRASRRAAALRGAGCAIEHLEEAHEPARRSAAGELLLTPANLTEVRARARSVLEEARFVFDELVDSHQVVGGGLDEARRALRAPVRVLGLEDAVTADVGGIPGPVSARARDTVLVVEAAVEPNGRVERAVLVDEEKRELRFERLRVGLGGEVAAEVFARLTNGVGDAVDDLTNAALAVFDRFVTGLAANAGLPEVLRDDDVGCQLAPRRGHLGAVHLEDDGAIRVRDRARAALVDDLVQGIGASGRVFAGDADPSFLPVVFLGTHGFVLGLQVRGAASPRGGGGCDVRDERLVSSRGAGGRVHDRLVDFHALRIAVMAVRFSHFALVIRAVRDARLSHVPPHFAWEPVFFRRSRAEPPNSRKRSKLWRYARPPVCAPLP